jgi:methylmalonyl-CoA mutase C-terminal domain/subunit
MSKIKILIAKPGLDGHDRGAKVMANSFRDSGIKVIYTGLRQTPEQIVKAAIQEDVDFIGLSVLSGAHMHLCKEIMNLLKKQDAIDINVIVGGIIPDEDINKLKKIGVKKIFGPGTFMKDAVEFLKINYSKK